MAAHRRDLSHSDHRFTRVGIRRRTQYFDIFDALDASGHPVVVKQARALDELGRLRFAREARLGRLLKHDGLARVVDSGDDWIVFERLTIPLNTQPSMRSEAQILQLLCKLATILGHLHGQGIVHRDLKPAHILFRGHEPVFIDLGVAGLVANDPLEGTEIVGSPAWMAPEQALGAAPAPAADVWSLCAVAYWLICGQPLYAGDADSVLHARQHGYDRRPDLSGIKSHRLVELLANGFEPAKKRPTAAEFAAALRNLPSSEEAKLNPIDTIRQLANNRNKKDGSFRIL